MNIKLKNFNRLHYLKNYYKLKKVNTICQVANCPNRYECFTAQTATFLLLGDICTRNCQYCYVTSGRPKEVDHEELNNILTLIDYLQLDYVVLTQVTRDDLSDGGAEYIVKVVNAIRKRKPRIKIELLISDLNGNWQALEKILAVKPDVINHNIEVTRNYFELLRPMGDYNRSLEILSKIKGIKKKSGLMVGFGESLKDIEQTLRDLRKVGVDMITIGQYLQPSQNEVAVQKFYSENEFAQIKAKAYQLGFQFVEAGQLVRSSYRAKAGFYNE